jgi:hypothetical protein
LLLDFFSTSIVSIPTHLLDNFSDFIFLANSMTYAENRRNRGLTGFAKIEEQVSKAFAQVSAQRTGANLGHLAPCP